MLIGTDDHYRVEHGSMSRTKKIEERNFQASRATPSSIMRSSPDLDTMDLCGHELGFGRIGSLRFIRMDRGFVMVEMVDVLGGFYSGGGGARAVEGRGFRGSVRSAVAQEQANVVCCLLNLV
jgi:hypothetical protein